MSEAHEFNPDWTIAPSETLREWMDENGMSVRVLAASSVWLGPKSVTKVQAAALIQDVLDRKPLTAAHATTLARGTGVEVRFWLALEHNYRAGLAAGLTHASGPLRLDSEPRHGHPGDSHDHGDKRNVQARGQHEGDRS